MRRRKSVTPGELLLEWLLKPMGASQYRLAKEIGVPAQRIQPHVRGPAGVPSPRASVSKTVISNSESVTAYRRAIQLRSLLRSFGGFVRTA